MLRPTEFFFTAVDRGSLLRLTELFEDLDVRCLEFDGILVGEKFGRHTPSEVDLLGDEILAARRLSLESAHSSPRAYRLASSLARASRVGLSNVVPGNSLRYCLDAESTQYIQSFGAFFGS